MYEGNLENGEQQQEAVQNQEIEISSTHDGKITQKVKDKAFSKFAKEFFDEFEPYVYLHDSQIVALANKLLIKAIVFDREEFPFEVAWDLQKQSLLFYIDQKNAKKLNFMGEEFQ